LPAAVKSFRYRAWLICVCRCFNLITGKTTMPFASHAANSRRFDFSALAAALALTVSGCANFEAPKPLVQVPGNLAADSKESLRMVVPASGVQIYECRAKQNPAGTYEWMFVAPAADLYDVRGQRIGRHYGGPHWEATDGSKIVGAVRERADAPATAAIPWLLLSARSVGANGAFNEITSIQRVNTAGGTAPQGGCAQATAGAQARVQYTADYYFFGVGPAPRQTPVATGSDYPTY
jgi:hypothetical protein